MKSLPWVLALAGSAAIAACATHEIATKGDGPYLGQGGAAQPPVEAMTGDSVPANFVQNIGQWDPGALFRARFGAVTVFLEEHGWTVSRPSGSDSAAAIRMQLRGADQCEVVGEAQLPGYHNYLRGTDSTRWRTGVPLFGSVLYVSPLPGVDLRAYTKDGHFEYDLILAPGTDLSPIEFEVQGADGIRLRADGALVIETPIGPLVQPAPKTWQTSPSGEQQLVSCSYVITGDASFGFSVIGWDQTHQLTVDPGLIWSTFLGGSGKGLSFDDVARDLHVDSSGIITVVGSTTSEDFPTALGAYNPSMNGGTTDAFVTRFDPSKQGPAQLIYSSYLGGEGDDTPSGCHVDQDGVITVVGSTASTSFPTSPNAYDSTYGGGVKDCFIAILDPRLAGPNQLIYGSYFGGAGTDVCTGLEITSAGTITIAGRTSGTSGFPTSAGAYNPSFNGGAYDAFVAQLDPTRSGSAQLVYSTFLGGSTTDQANDVSVDAGGVITISGGTESIDFPVTAGAYNTSFNGGRNDAFVAQLDPSLGGAAQLTYSTFLGGPDSEQANAHAVDPYGLVTITGIASNDTFPTTADAFDSTFNGGAWDAFISQLNPSLTGALQLSYSTIIGGSSGDFGLGVVVNPGGQVTITGEIGGHRSNYPTTAGAFDRTHAGGGGDAYVTRMDFTRVGVDQLIYSTFMGSGQYDRGICIHPHGNGVVVGGTTASNLFPTTTGAFDRDYNGSGDAFISHLDLLPTGVATFGASTPGCAGPVWIGAIAMPAAGSTGFTLTSTNGPPGALGVACLGAGALTAPLPILGAGLWINPAPPFMALPSATNARGSAELNLPIPAGVPAGISLAAQFLWFGPAAPPPCPAQGVSASDALLFTILP